MSSFGDTLAEYEAIQKEIVCRETFGHLAPQEDRAYPGRIVFGASPYWSQGVVILFCEFEGLGDSPWFYEAVNDFISDQENKAGCVYEFMGQIRNYEFTGKLKMLTDFNKATTDRS